MAAAILPTSLSIFRPSDRRFSSLNILTAGDHFHLEFRHLSLQPPSRFPCPPIRMGGGPRTFPGGVSKWQWKRMQAKKSKQLLKARLLRERQIYEMRKRTELKAAVSELERPWEVVERAPNLFSVSADEQLKILADRFQRPGGFDMWSDRDGPQVFSSPDGLQSTRFFPKGAVHSIKPYEAATEDGEKEDLRFDDWIARGGGNTRKRRTRRSPSTVVDIEVEDSTEGNGEEEQSGKIVRSREDGRASHRISAARDFLRPGAELYAEDGGNRMRDYSGGSRVRDSTGSQFGLDGSGTRGKFAERNDDGRGDRRTDVERVSLRPTADVYGGRGGMEKRDIFEQGGRFGKERAVNSHGEGKRGKNGGRGNLRTSAGRGRGRENAGRPSANLYAEDGSYRNRDFSDSSSSERRKRLPSANLYAEDGGNRMRDYSGGSRVRDSMGRERVSLRPTADVYGGRGGMEKRDRFEQGGRFGKERAVNSHGEGQRGKNGGRGNLRTNAGRGRGWENAGRLSANLYAEDGGYRNRDFSDSSSSERRKRLPSANLYAEYGGYRNRDFSDSSSSERRKRSPSANLYAQDGGYRKQDYSDGSSSERRQRSEKSSLFEPYATHTVGNGERHHRGGWRE